MKLGLKGKNALITGGSRGIGLGAAQLLAAEGCHLHLAARSATDLESAKAGILRDHAVEISCHAMDLSNTANAVALAKECGDVDFLVNNAGTTKFVAAPNLEGLSAARHRLGRQSLAVIIVGHIGADYEGICAGVTALLGNRFSWLRAFAVVDQHRCALLRQQKRCRRPDAGRRPRHDRAFTFEIHDLFLLRNQF